MIELAELLRGLRRELAEAAVERPIEGLRFQLGPVEVEAVVAVERQRSGNGKITFYVAEIGGSGQLTASETQRIKLVLQPVAADGGDPPWVSGPAVGAER